MNLFKKKKEEQKTMTTLEEVRKAYESLGDEDKGKFAQSLSSRVDESVGAREAESNTEDSQTAKDRVSEAEGEEKANKAESAGSAENAGMDVKKEIKEEKQEMTDFSAISEKVDSVAKIVEDLVKRHETLLTRLEQGEVGAKSKEDEKQKEDNAGPMEKLYRQKAGY